MIGNIYDVYIAGKLRIYGDDGTGELSREEAYLDPFSFTVGEPFDLIFNSAPKINVYPKKIKMIVGSGAEVTFGEPYDFENNNVWFEEMVIQTEYLDRKNEIESWLFFNETENIRDMKLKIDVPIDAAVATFQLEFIFADDHAREPM